MTEARPLIRRRGVRRRDLAGGRRDRVDVTTLRGIAGHRRLALVERVAIDRPPHELRRSAAQSDVLPEPSAAVFATSGIPRYVPARRRERSECADRAGAKSPLPVMTRLTRAGRRPAT